MTLGPTLETERLILRPPEEQDFEAWAEMNRHEETMRFIGGVMEPATTWRYLATMIGHWHIRGYGMFSIIEKSTGSWLGRAGPWFPEGWPEPEIGWGLIPQAQGKGFATETAAACMDHAVDTLGWQNVVHCIDKDNTASIKLAERIGSKWLREVDPPKPFIGFKWQVYGQTAAEWRQNRVSHITGA